jgi:DNA-binding NarL/FixJ family response regulator
MQEATARADRHALALMQGRGRLYLAGAGVEAEKNLRDAIGIFQRLSATPWRRRAALELRQRGLQVPRHRAPRATLLTDTEMQIARLVQLGRPNRDIAAAVCLSVKTVETYLSRIYGKTNCNSRMELARAMDAGRLG